MSLSDSNKQILNDIQSLQNLEQQMFSNLEENPNLKNEQRKEIIQKINQISQMRINLYNTLGNLNQTFQGALWSSYTLMDEQSAAVGIVEKELNESKKNLELLEDEKNNQIRMIEINDYYSQRYANHTRIFKTILIPIIIFLVLFFLTKKEMMPVWLFYILCGLLLLITLWFLLPMIYYTSIRDNMVYQEYDWQFDPSTAPPPATNTTENSVDPWEAPPSTCGSVSGSLCQGQECCDKNSIYDPNSNICIQNNNILSGNFNASQSFNKSFDRFTNVLSTGFNKTRSGIANTISGSASNLAYGINNITNVPEAFTNYRENDGETASYMTQVMEALTQPEKGNRYKKPDATLDWDPKENTSGQYFANFNGFGSV